MTTTGISTPIPTGGPWRWLLNRRRRRVRGRAIFVAAVAWLVLLTLSAVFANFIPGLPSYEQRIGELAQGPDFSSLGTILGTDSVGRSNLSRIIYGARISLTIAVVGTGLGVLIGLVFGVLAGYYRGVSEGVANVAANALAAVPPLLFLLALVAAIGSSLPSLTFALGLLISDLFIRVTKGATISNANRDYVLAAKALGATDFRILTREILPNLVPVLGAVIPISMAVLIVVEGSLSFLGYGIPAPDPSWGGMIAAGADVIRRFPLIIAAPVGTLFLTVYAFNVIGDVLSNRADQRDIQL